MSQSQTVGVVLIGVNIMIFAPILLYYWARFRSASHGIRIKHKNKKLIYFIMTFCTFGFIIHRPLVIACNKWKINDTLVPLWIVAALDSIYIGLFFTMNSIHLWLLYYNKKHQIALAELPWQQQINPRYRSWYISNRQTWGNPLYIATVLICPFCVYITIQLFVEYILHIFDTDAYNFTLLSILFAIPSFILYFQFKNHTIYCNSDCGKKESFYQSVILMIFVIINCVCCIAETFLFYNLWIVQKIVKSSYNYQLISNMVCITQEFTTSTVLFTSALLTIYIAWKQALSIQSEPMNQKAMRRHSSTKPSSETHGVKEMLKTISTLAGFNAFMQHLIKEWAAENLLFVLELMSIKFAFQEKNNDFDPSKQTSTYNDDMHSILSRLTPTLAPETPVTPFSDISPNSDEIYDDELEIEYPDTFNHSTAIHSLSPMRNPTLAPIKSGIEMSMEKVKSMSSTHNTPTIRSKQNSLIQRFNTKRMSSVELTDGIVSCLYNMDGSVWSEVKLPCGLPKSEVLNTKNTLIEQLYELYLKYIESGCEQEINIAYYQRKHITDVLQKVIVNKKNEQYDTQLEHEIFGLMDGAAVEILSLLTDAYMRFAVSSEGKALLSQNANV